MSDNSTNNTMREKRLTFLRQLRVSKRQKVPISLTCVLLCFSPAFVMFLFRDVGCARNLSSPTAEEIVSLGGGNHTNILDPFTYTIIPSKCSFSSHIINSPNILVIVKSAARNTKIREFVRKTWGSVKQTNVKVVFSLGVDALLTAVIKQESQEFSDILQMNFVDAYVNNTIKLMMSLDYVVRHCQSASLILFIDDDVVINFEEFLKLATNLNTRGDIFEGFLLDNAEPIRFVFSKWFLSCTEYPYVKWPPYLAGSCFLMSVPAVHKIHTASAKVKAMDADDAWLGLVAKVAGIEPKYNVFLNHEDRYPHKSIVKESKHDYESLMDTWTEIRHRRV